MEMLNTHAKAESPAPQGGGETVIVDTRFGVYEFAPHSQITLPQGLVGMADMTHFGLANLPPPLSEDLKLLQSLDGDPLSFIVWPTTPDAAPIAAEDLTDACKALGLDPQTLALLFLVTVLRRAGRGGLSAAKGRGRAPPSDRPRGASLFCLAGRRQVLPSNPATRPGRSCRLHEVRRAIH
jgi:hypothetical protein